MVKIKILHTKIVNVFLKSDIIQRDKFIFRCVHCGITYYIPPEMPSSDSPAVIRLYLICPDLNIMSINKDWTLSPQIIISYEPQKIKS